MKIGTTTFPLANISEEIANMDNVEEAFDYVVGHLECAEQREKYRPQKEKMCVRLQKELADGTFRIKDFREMEVRDGPKVRKVQAPRVYGRVGCHAVMVVIEKYCYPVLIKNTAASIKGSFKGMACHADCKHLFYKLTGKRMKKFGEMGITYTPKDGKKRFAGNTMRLSAIQNKTIEVHDYEKDVKTSQGDNRYLVSFKDVQSGTWGKFFTASEELKCILDQVGEMENGFPFETVIVSEVFDGGKTKYRFT